MKKISVLFYGATSYLAFLGSVFYAIGFAGNALVKNPIDEIPATPASPAILIDVSMLLCLLIQRKAMSTPAFKSWLMRFVPQALERCSRVLLWSLSLLMVMWQWQPLGGLVWSIQNGVVQTLMNILYLAGWGIAFVSTFLINHFELFGLRQVWLYYKGEQYTPLSFRLPGFYRLARHPLYLGFFITFWSAPVMTLAHLLLSMIGSLYILVALIENREPLVHIMEKFRTYKKAFPLILPFLKKRIMR